jgi:hypothetical protein
VIEVKVRYTKKAQSDASLMGRLAQPMALGSALAQRVSQRVLQQGDTATPFRAYAGTRERQGKTKKDGSSSKPRTAAFVVSQDYAQAVGLQQTRFDSSADFHQRANVRLGSFRVSGGMWSGLQVRNVGSNGVLIDFAGSSVGGLRQSATTASGRTRKRAVKIRNQLKAGTVFRSSGVNVIQPKDNETDALAAAVCRWSQNITGRILGADAEKFSTTADQQLLQMILQRFDGSR